MTKRKSPRYNDAVTLPSQDPSTCSYSNGSCTNPRATKTTGEPHTLCEEHRERANAAQRKSQLTKRQKRDAAESECQVSPTSVTAVGRVSRSDVESLARELRARGILVPAEHCSYSKNHGCREPRAYKTNGTLHRFCERHRVQAKEDQARHMEAKRRKQRRLSDRVEHVYQPQNQAFDGQQFHVLESDEEVELALEHLESRALQGSPAGTRLVGFTDIGSFSSGGLAPMQMLHPNVDWDAAMLLLDKYSDFADFVDAAYESVQEDEAE